MSRLAWTKICSWYFRLSRVRLYKRRCETCVVWSAHLTRRISESSGPTSGTENVLERSNHMFYAFVRVGLLLHGPNRNTRSFLGLVRAGASFDLAETGTPQRVPIQCMLLVFISSVFFYFLLSALFYVWFFYSSCHLWFILIFFYLSFIPIFHLIFVCSYVHAHVSRYVLLWPLPSMYVMFYYVICDVHIARIRCFIIIFVYYSWDVL